MEYNVHKFGKYSNDPVYVHMLNNGKKLSMELDTGAEVSIISEKTKKEIFPEEKLRPSKYQWIDEGNRHIEGKGPVRGSAQDVGISGHSW